MVRERWSMAHDLTGQAARYLAAAGIVLAGTFPAAFVLLWTGLSVPATANILFVPVVAAKFLLYKYWVFKNTLPRWLQQPTFYVFIAVAGWGIFVGIQYVGMLFLGLTEWAAFGTAFLIAGALR